MEKVRVTLFDTKVDEKRLREIIYSLRNYRSVERDGNDRSSIITDHDEEVPEWLRKVWISGGRIAAVNYSLLIEGALAREDVGYEIINFRVRTSRWKRL